MPGLIVLIIVFLLLSGGLAMIDAAILSVSAGEVEELADAKKWGAVSLRKITRHVTRSIIVIVIFTNLINVAGPIIIGQQTEIVFHSKMIGLLTAILTFLSIVFSEIIPKAVGAHYAPTISRMVAPFILFLVTILYPLVFILEKITHLFRHGRRKIGTERQIMALAHIGEGAGHIAGSEQELIQRAFTLHDHKTSTIMTPRHKIIAMPADATIRYGARMVFRYSYSRYPLFGESLDDIRGQAISRDILEALAEGKDMDHLDTVKHEVLTVSPDMLCNHLLALFRRKQIHLAIVQKDGKTLGLVTLEDVLEELVGEIEDEGDAV